MQIVRSALLTSMFLVCACSLANFAELTSGALEALPDTGPSEADDGATPTAADDGATPGPEPDGSSADAEVGIDAASLDGGAPLDGASDASVDATPDAQVDAHVEVDAGPCSGPPVKVTAFRAPSFATTAPKAGATAGWSQLTNALKEDGETALASQISQGKPSEYLVVTNFGFGLADSARIVGVELEVVRKAKFGTPFTVQDDEVGLAMIDHPSKVTAKDPAAWSTAMTTTHYGGPTDTFGEVLTGAIVKDGTGFGAGMSVSYGISGGGAEVDAIRMKLHYCE